MGNVDVPWLRISVGGIDLGSVKAKKSCHKQLIQRLWRDVSHGCINLHYNMFCFLE